MSSDLLGPSRIIVVRHGETDWNAVSRVQGQQDIPLNDRGREQAVSVGQIIREAYPETIGFDYVASPLSRTRETMSLMRGAMGLAPDDYRVDPRLMELHFGTWQGFAIEEVRVTDPEGVAARDRDKWGFVPPGGESYAVLSDRIAGWLSEIVQPSVVVTHGGVARVLLGLLAGVSKDVLPNVDIRQGRALLFEGGIAQWI